MLLQVRNLVLWSSVVSTLLRMTRNYRHNQNSGRNPTSIVAMLRLALMAYNVVLVVLVVDVVVIGFAMC